MNTFTEQLKRAAEDVRLTSAEKDVMRATLRAAMRADTPVPSPLHFVLPRVATLALTLVFVVGGGTAYAAQGALPGDTLYPVKRALNERVEAVFALSEMAKIKLDARLAARRLAEASALSREGRLSEETEQELAADFDKHAGDVLQSLAEDEARDPVEIRTLAASFEDELLAYEGPTPAPVAEAARGATLMMAAMFADEKSAGVEAPERPLSASVRAARERLESVRARIEEKRIQHGDVRPEKTESIERATTTAPRDIPERPRKEEERRER
jgi:hypothetical protein